MSIKELVFITSFPDQISNYLNQSIPLKAQEKNKVSIKVFNIRKHKAHQIDDYAFGGGTGMLMMLEPILDILKSENLLNEHIILLSARGQTFKQNKAVELANLEGKKIVFICAHYEGVDERICDYITEEISVGDYLLSSGELASLIVADALIRLIPGVINPTSLESESFSGFLLDYPSYTRPAEYEGKIVPEVLRSGNHALIEKYRFEERIRITKKFRPDLYEKYLESIKGVDDAED